MSESPKPKSVKAGRVLTRRAFVKSVSATGIATGLVALSGMTKGPFAKAMTKMTVTLPWLPEGSYAWIYAARAKGYWKERGIDGTIVRGYGSMAAAQGLFAGKFDAGVVSAGASILLSTKGVDLVSLDMSDYLPPMCVAMLADSPIKVPKDLEGKTVAQTLSSVDAPYLSVFCKATGVDFSKIKTVNVDAKVRGTSLMEKRVDAITGIMSSILPITAPAGKPTRYFVYRNYGVPLYGNTCVMVKPQLLDKDRGLCERLADGLMEGARYQLLEPEAARQTFLDAVPELRMSKNAPESARLAMAIQSYSMLAEPGVKEHGLGWTDYGRLQKMAELTISSEARGAKVPDVRKLFLNDFAGKLKLSATEWKTAEGGIGDIAKVFAKA